jgi:hypothetical protein
MLKDGREFYDVHGVHQPVLVHKKETQGSTDSFSDALKLLALAFGLYITSTPTLELDEAESVD